MAAGGANERTWTGIEEIVVPLPLPAGHEPLTMTFCRIPAGAFRMGVRNTFSDQEPIHDIVMPYEYWLGSHIVTYEQYGAVVKGLGLEGNERPDRISRTLDKIDRGCPHEQVAWRDVSFWCVALTG
jgi:formylglycine-generating enzyme required for sulfatase activity